jgi:co-chaperonin GroES (HSP10)
LGTAVVEPPEEGCVVSVLDPSVDGEDQLADLTVEVADRVLADKLGHPC